MNLVYDKDGIKVFLKTDENGRVKDARYYLGLQ